MYTVALLGAGASVEAGVPTAAEMTTRFIDLAEKEADHTASSVLRFVVGELLGKSFQNGQKIGRLAVNVEDVLRTVNILANRHQNELAPFISAWDTRIEVLDKYILDAGARQNFANVLQTLADNNEYSAENPAPPETQADLIYFLVQAVNMSRGCGFAHTIDWLLKKLFSIAYLESDAKTWYFAPFAKEAHRSSTTIATLNYDNAIERVCIQYDIPIDLGVREWKDTFKLDFEGGALKLLKLHGSVQWAQSLDTTPPSPVNTWGDAAPDVSLLSAEVATPAIIFGERNKLSAQGPMLLLFEEFRRDLSNADRLVVIGYSFGDAHVNEIIWQWLFPYPERRIEVYDKFAASIRSRLPTQLKHLETRFTFRKMSASKALPGLRL